MSQEFDRQDLSLKNLTLLIYDITQALIAMGLILGTLFMLARGQVITEGQWGAFWFVLGFFFRSASGQGRPLPARVREQIVTGVFVALGAALMYQGVAHIGSL